jgi:hypothetical protein
MKKATKWRPLSFRKVGNYKLVRHGSANVLMAKSITVKLATYEGVSIVARVTPYDISQVDPKFSALPSNVQDAIAKMFVEFGE